MSKLNQLRRKMSNDGLNPFQQASGAELRFKNHTEKARVAEQQHLRELRDKERSKKTKGKSSSSDSGSDSQESSEGENRQESDKEDNEDLPDYKENGYHPVHIG